MARELGCKRRLTLVLSALFASLLVPFHLLLVANHPSSSLPPLFILLVLGVCACAMPLRGSMFRAVCARLKPTLRPTDRVFLLPTMSLSLLLIARTEHSLNGPDGRDGADGRSQFEKAECCRGQCIQKSKKATNCLVKRNESPSSVVFDVAALRLHEVASLFLNGAKKANDDKLEKYLLGILNNPRLCQPPLESNILAMFAVYGQQ